MCLIQAQCVRTMDGVTKEETSFGSTFYHYQIFKMERKN